MGRQRLKTIEAEVGGELNAETLAEEPRADMTSSPRVRQPAGRDTDRYWRNLFGAAANTTSPEALAAWQARQITDAPAIGEASIAGMRPSLPDGTA